MKISYCYIIFSRKINKFYIGVTQESIEQRIIKHNQKLYGTRYTSITDDWELFISIEAENYGHAVRMERKIKSLKSRKYIQNLKEYPELREKLFKITKSS